MDYVIIDIPHGKQIKIDIPVDITCMEFAFKYHDGELNEIRESHVGCWMVDDGENAPKHFKVAAKEFRKPVAAINYARAQYIKFLKEEIHRVRGCDNDL